MVFFFNYSHQGLINNYIIQQQQPIEATYNPIDIFKGHCVEIENLRLTFPDSAFIIPDDFNQPGVKWSNAKHAILSDPSSDKSKVLAETITFDHLFQHNFIENYKYFPKINTPNTIAINDKFTTGGSGVTELFKV